MTINQNTKYILDHPQTKEAVEEYSKGNTKPLERLLFEIQFHVFDKTTLYCSKIYGLNKWNNSGVIKDFIRTAEPPTNLSIYLTTPPKSSL
jgi:hypothetical protein